MRSAAASNRRIATLVALLASSGFCLALLVAREQRTGSEDYDFLAWNLLLAWVPFVLALLVYDARRRGVGTVGRLALGGLWLLFLPNAPYIVTDLIHLGRITGAPLWFDAGMIAAFAFMGLVLGLGSLFLVQLALADAFGPRGRLGARARRIPLCSVGVYVGRFLRLNSWDAIVDPSVLASPVREFLLDPFAAGRFLAVTFLFTGFLALSYFLLYSIAHGGLALEPARRPLMPRGYTEGPAAEEAERRREELRRASAAAPNERDGRLRLDRGRAGAPFPRLAGEVDPDELFASGRAWGLSVVRRRGSRPTTRRRLRIRRG